MNPLFARLWQVALGWLYALLGGKSPVDGAPVQSESPDSAVAKREAGVQGAIAEAEVQAPRTQDELAERLEKGTF